MPEEKVEEKDSDVASDGLYLKVSESLAELMNSSPVDNTSHLLTTTLLSLIIRQNLGSSIEEIKSCLDQAQKKRFLLQKEGNEEEIKILDTTIETLSRFLEKAQVEKNNFENIVGKVDKTMDSVKGLELLNSRNYSKLKEIEEQVLKLKDSNQHTIDITDSGIDIKDIPKGDLIRGLMKTLAVLVVILLLMLVFSLSCNIFGKIGES